MQVMSQIPKKVRIVQQINDHSDRVVTKPPITTDVDGTGSNQATSSYTSVLGATTLEQRVNSIEKV